MKTRFIIRDIWSEVFNKENISEELSFSDLGGNAKLADEVYRLFVQAFGKELNISTTIAYDYPTIDAQTIYINQLLLKGKGRNWKIKIADYFKRKKRKVKHQDDIAVIGMACRFPGHINTPEALWQALASGQDLLEEVPKSRWDIDAYYSTNRKDDGKMVTRRGGFIDHHDCFDAAFFHIAPVEAEFLDPNQRIILETAWHALENSGIAPTTLKGSNTGVFVGCMFHDYEVLLERSNLKLHNLKYLDIGASQGAVAGRIAYTLGLQGPAMMIDTACSSSLTAIHEACQHLRHGECDLALAGGVNLMLLPEVSISFSQANMLSPDGECRSFSEDANGYVRSEGCGIVVLKRLKEAQRDGDNILAVLKGSAVNQDGASGGITVPNRLAQEALIEKALQSAKLKSEAIDYIEAHGTGTPLGDPIEMGAIETIYRGRKRPLYVGSIKSNMGHLEAAAGVAGLIKVILALQHEAIPQNLHFKKINPRIHLENIPAEIVTQKLPWPKQKRHLRRAGISSYGFTGTNVHLIVEEAPLSHAQSIKTSLPLTLFNRKRYWLKELAPIQSGTLDETGHPLLGRKLELMATESGFAFEQSLAIQQKPLNYLEAHKILDKVLFPAAGFIELMLASLHILEKAKAIELRDLNLTSALQLWPEQVVEIQTLIKTVEANDAQEILIYSRVASENEMPWQLHARAFAVARQGKTPDSVSVQDWSARCQQQIEVQAFYETLVQQGFAYGPAFQTVSEVHYGDQVFFAKLYTQTTDKAYQAYPAMLDGALQVAVSVFNQDNSMEQAGAFLPIGFKCLSLYQTLPSECDVYAELKQIATDVYGADFYFYNTVGELVLEIEGFQFKRTQKAILEQHLAYEAPVSSLFLKPTWEPIDIDYLKQESVTVVESQLLSFDARATGVSELDLDLVERFLTFLKTCIHNNITNIAIQVLTEQAYSVQGEAICLNQSILNGFIKAAILEHPALHIRQIDIEQNQDWALLSETLEDYQGDEQLLALRAGKWYSAKVKPLAVANTDEQQLTLLEHGYQLVKSASGALQDLHLIEQRAVAIEAHEVLLQPTAVGLNFRDVLNAMY